MSDIEMYMPRGGVQGHAGQATMVEASRAEAEVRAQVVLARQFPRDVPAALARTREMFAVPGQADRAFYSYRKGGSTVSGSTIHLAKGVAQAWGNLTYGIDEMSRAPGQSEMRAWAWDLETNQRVSTTFIVEHAMDVKDGRKELVDLRSIYENNANMANRRLRAQIESVIPAYVMDIAREAAGQTLRHGGGQPLPVRIAEAVKTFEGLGVALDQLEVERGRPSGRWSEIDLAHLRTLGMTISSGQLSVAEAFPPVALSVDDVRPAGPVSQSAQKAPQPSPAPSGEEDPRRPDLHLWTEEQIAEAFPGAVRQGPEMFVPRRAEQEAPQGPASGPSWDGVEYPPEEEQPAAGAPSDGVVWPTVARPGGSDG